ncbi:hypothetical protein [Thiomicrolovo sp. ZZH C-3]
MKLDFSTPKGFFIVWFAAVTLFSSISIYEEAAVYIAMKHALSSAKECKYVTGKVQKYSYDYGHGRESFNIENVVFLTTTSILGKYYSESIERLMPTMKVQYFTFWGSPRIVKIWSETDGCL